jgi:hypothetical protein
MKVENATIGTRVIAKDLSDCLLGGLASAKGQAGVIVDIDSDEAVIVRFDEKFNSSLWKRRSSGGTEGRHWAVPLSDLKLESKTVA